MALTVVRDCRVVEPSEVLLKHEVMQLTEEEKLGATHPCLITDTKSTSEEELVDGEEPASDIMKKKNSIREEQEIAGKTYASNIS
jgi:hypothetical protein